MKKERFKASKDWKDAEERQERNMRRERERGKERIHKERMNEMK